MACRPTDGAQVRTAGDDDPPAHQWYTVGLQSAAEGGAASKTTPRGATRGLASGAIGQADSLTSVSPTRTFFMMRCASASPKRPLT